MMVSLLEVYKLVEQRKVISFLLSEDEKLVNIYSRVDKIVRLQKFLKRVEKFKDS